MPQNKFALARYRLIDELLRKNDYVKTIDIVNTCKERLGFEVTQRTIQLDMETLKNDSFIGCYFPVCYCKRNRAYYYSEEPRAFLFTICLHYDELLLLKKIEETLKALVSDEDLQMYCEILKKIESFYTLS